MNERRKELVPAALAALVWVGMIGGVFGRAAVDPPARNSVVPIYLTAGERWRAGEPLYPPVPGMDLYRNPPGVAAMFAPFTLLDPKPAAHLWRAVCLLAYAYGVRRFLRHVLPPLGPWRHYSVWTLSAVLVVPALNNGQINLAVLATAVCGTAAAARGRWWEAAFWLGGGVWLKVYPVAVALLAILAAPRTLGWRVGVMTAYLFAVPFLAQEPGFVWNAHFDWLAEMKTDDRSEADIVRAPRDWTIVPRIFFGVTMPRAVTTPVAILAAVVFAGLVLTDRKPHRWLLPPALGLIWMTLFGPSTEMNTYALVAPVAAAVVVLGPRLPRWACGCAWAGTGCLVASMVRAAFVTTGPLPLHWIQPVGTALLLAAVVGWWKANRRCEPPGEVISGTGGI